MFATNVLNSPHTVNASDTTVRVDAQRTVLMGETANGGDGRDRPKAVG